MHGYNVPVPMMQHHQGRRQNQQPEYYHPGYYQQPQYHPAHHGYAPQWYTGPYQAQQAYRPYPPYPPQPHHNGPMIVSSHPQHQSVIPPQHRPSYTSPVPIPTSTMVPPVSTPASAQSHEAPAPSTPSPASIQAPTVSTAPSAPPHPQSPPAITKRLPFYPKLPWYSVSESDYPPRTRRKRRRVRQASPTDIELPERLNKPTTESKAAPTNQEAIPLNTETPELDTTFNHGITSSSDLSAESPLRHRSDISTAEPSTTQTTPKSHVKPVLPVVPVAPKISQESAPAASQPSQPDEETKVEESIDSNDKNVSEVPQTEATSPPSKAPPKSWAELLRSKGPSASQTLQNGGSVAADASLAKSKTASLAEILKSFDVSSSTKIPFLEPRGLVNTGNMCYMNSILQVLVFCIPFYDFLEQVGKNAAHSFKSDTPLLDAMILFMREFSIIDAAESVEKLRMRLKDNELEQYGESFIPEYVYNVIKHLPRFSTMRRGHQQDAEEFMGFLLQGLNDECALVLKNLPVSTEVVLPKSPVSDRSQATDAGWLEVGPKQKSAVTRASGFDHPDSPITKIFVGKFRSELRVPGLKTSVTMEPYQTLPLDIGAPTVHNIVDALKGLTRPETLHGDFGSPRGPGATATKQTFIDTLPPVLILHLKRFHFENTGGVQKIWKKVGYPLELTLPKEVFSPSRRNAVALSGMPKYRLSAVVYHHGKNASGGHYTVDLRRQDGLEWIRLDDTIIRRLRAEDVASGGAEEDPKVLAKALEQHKRQQSAAGGQNMFDSIGSGDEEKEEDDEGGWNQVNGSNSKDPSSGRKWAAVANGANGETTPNAGKRSPLWESAKDNKVAYILFYRKIE